MTDHLDGLKKDWIERHSGELPVNSSNLSMVFSVLAQDEKEFIEYITDAYIMFCDHKRYDRY